MLIQKIKDFFKKNGLYIIIGLLTLIVVLMSISRKKNIQDITKKVENLLDKTKDKITDININQSKNEIEKNIKLEQNELKKKDYESRLQIITTITDRKRRLKKLIEFNKSIEVNFK